MAIVEPTSNMLSEELSLRTALVATPISTTLLPNVQAIYASIENLCGPLALPTDITLFPPDFILYFDTPEKCSVVESMHMLFGPGFNMLLRPWDSEYRSQPVDWDTPVTIDITGIPPYALFKQTLEPVLGSYCDIQAYSFKNHTGTCRVEAFAASTAAVPTNDIIGVPRRGPNGARYHTYSITLQTYLHGEAPEDKDEDHECDMSFDVNDDDLNYDANDDDLNYDIDSADEHGVDRDLYDELWKMIWRAEDSRNANDAAVAAATCYFSDFHRNDG